MMMFNLASRRRSLNSIVPLIIIMVAENELRKQDWEAKSGVQENHTFFIK